MENPILRGLDEVTKQDHHYYIRSKYLRRLLTACDGNERQSKRKMPWTKHFTAATQHQFDQTFPEKLQSQQLNCR